MPAGRRLPPGRTGVLARNGRRPVPNQARRPNCREDVGHLDVQAASHGRGCHQRRLRAATRGGNANCRLYTARAPVHLRVGRWRRRPRRRSGPRPSTAGPYQLAADHGGGLHHRHHQGLARRRANNGSTGFRALRSDRVRLRPARCRRAPRRSAHSPLLAYRREGPDPTPRSPSVCSRSMAPGRMSSAAKPSVASRRAGQ